MGFQILPSVRLLACCAVFLSVFFLSAVQWWSSSEKARMLMAWHVLVSFMCCCVSCLFVCCSGCAPCCCAWCAVPCCLVSMACLVLSVYLPLCFCVCCAAPFFFVLSCFAVLCCFLFLLLCVFSCVLSSTCICCCLLCFVGFVVVPCCFSSPAVSVCLLFACWCVCLLLCVLSVCAAVVCVVRLFRFPCAWCVADVGEDKTTGWIVRVHELVLQKKKEVCRVVEHSLWCGVDQLFSQWVWLVWRQTERTPTSFITHGGSSIAYLSRICIVEFV